MQGNLDIDRQSLFQAGRGAWLVSQVAFAGGG